jgi:hypothetical protein
MNPRNRTESVTSVVALAAVMVMLAAGPALGQTVPPPTAAPPRPQVPVRKVEPPQPGTNWYLGALTGLQMVERTGPVAGLEFGVRVRKNVNVVFEGGWMKDVVTESRLNELASFVSYLQQTQGLPATGDMDGPAWFGLVGLRYIFENSSGIRPYVLVNGGVARVEYRPEFTLNNVRISSNVIGYGITLGRDLLGPGTHVAYGGGAGIVTGQKWYFDLGFRLTRINTPDHHTDVRRLSIGVGRRF